MEFEIMNLDVVQPGGGPISSHSADNVADYTRNTVRSALIKGSEQP